MQEGKENHWKERETLNCLAREAVRHWAGCVVGGPLPLLVSEMIPDATQINYYKEISTVPY